MEYKRMNDYKQTKTFSTYPESTSEQSIHGSSRNTTASLHQESKPPIKKLHRFEVISNTNSGIMSVKNTYKAFVGSGDMEQESSATRKTRWALASTAIVLVALLLGALGYTFWYIFLAVQPVTAYQVSRQQSVDQSIGGGGLVYAHQQVDMSFPAAERVINVMIKAGDHVKQNQPLIKLDPTQLNVQVTQASNNVAAAQEYLNSVSSSSPYNPVTVAQAQQALDVAKNHYNALIAQASSPTLNSGNLISPVNGVITTVNINPGEVFESNSTLLTIMDLSTVVVRAKISLANLQQVKTGSPAQVTPSALPNLTLRGTVASIIPQADPQTDTFEAWVSVPNAQQVLLPGMSAFVRVQGKQNAFVVPRLAVLNPDRESSVFVVRNNHVSLQAVHVAGNAPDVFFIDSGLSANDMIVLLPLNRMHEGQAVTITKVEHAR
jgi:RND family efflux transporter MFP subunit